MQSEPISADSLEDVVEGELEADEASSELSEPSEAGVTLGQAASEYFEWAAKREEQRQKRRSNGAASSRGAKATPVFDEDARVAVTRFVSHFTPHLPLADLKPYGMAVFQETVGTNATNIEGRLQPVKEFLRYCWKQRGYTDENLGNHLRIKRSSGVKDDSQLRHEEAERFEMTEDGLEQLKTELVRHQEEMPLAVQAVAAAREDKDIRENAPLEAAREYQERLRSRIAELEYQIAHADVKQEDETGYAHLGSTVQVEKLDEHGNLSGATAEYTLVGPTEVDPAARRISVESPMGRGLVNKPVGELVEIEAPRGTMRFRVVAVHG